jgi:TetR/AcrR family fatty acid metabolism transcriptional regulator
MEDKKKVILKAATCLIAEKGFHETTTSDIAKEAQVAVGTIYNYFSTKEDILGQIFALAYTRRAQTLEEVTLSKMSLQAKLEKFLRIHFQDVLENPNLARLLMQEMTTSVKEELAPVRNYRSDLAEQLSRMFLSCPNPIDDPFLAGSLALGSIHAVTFQLVHTQEEWEVEDVVKKVSSFILTGLMG